MHFYWIYWWTWFSQNFIALGLLALPVVVHGASENCIWLYLSKIEEKTKANASHCIASLLNDTAFQTEALCAISLPVICICVNYMIAAFLYNPIHWQITLEQVKCAIKCAFNSSMNGFLLCTTLLFDRRFIKNNTFYHNHKLIEHIS